jgi:hypothetical protein
MTGSQIEADLVAVVHEICIAGRMPRIFQFNERVLRVRIRGERFRFQTGRNRNARKLEASQID